MILGTKSKRRIDLFSRFSIPFTIVSSDFDELSIDESLPVSKYVTAIAKGKGDLLEKMYPDEVILTLDTTVYFGNKVYNKPLDYDHALSMLNTFQGKCHEVWTGVCVKKGGKTYTESACTKVFFNPLTHEQIKQYLQTLDYLDKAGSYAIQDIGGLLIEKIEGDYYNVIGFPLGLVQKLLLHVDIDLWQHLTTSSLFC